MTKLAEEYYRVGGMAGNFERTAGNVRKHGKASDNLFGTAEDVFKNTVIAGIDELFNQDELQQLIEFYNSPIGRTLKQKSHEMGEKIHEGLTSALQILTSN